MGRQAKALGMVGGLLLVLVGLVGWLAFQTATNDDGDDRPRQGTRDATGTAAGTRRSPRGGASGARGAPGRITGEVRRSIDRAPVAAQRVSLLGVNRHPIDVATDEAGAFVFDDVPAGGPYDLLVVAESSAHVRVPAIELASGESRDVGTLWLAPAVRVVVEVVSFGGTPLGGAFVEAFPTTGQTGAGFDTAAAPAPVATASAGADGVAVLDGIAVGEWTIAASKPGWSRRGVSDVVLHAGEGDRRIRIALEQGHVLEGRVTERDGRSVAGARVVVLRRTLVADGTTAPLCLRTSTDAEGAYRVDGLPSADVCIWVARPGGKLAIVASVRPQGVSRLDIVLPSGGVLTGRVLDLATRAPIAGAKIALSMTILDALDLPLEATTGPDGAWRIDLPMPGTVNYIAASAPGYLGASDALLEQQSVYLTEGGSMEREILLERGAVVSGRVTSALGPVPSADVSVVAARGWFPTKTDRDGRYRSDAVPPGPALVWVGKPGFAQPDWPADPDASLRDGSAPAQYRVDVPTEGEATLDVTVVAGHPLSGRVEDHAGAPVAGARVGISGLDDGWSVTTGDDGAFRLERVTPGGQVSLWVRKEGWLPVEESVSTTADGPTEAVVLRITRKQRIRGVVRSSVGASLDGAYVQFSYPLRGSSPVDLEWARLSAERHSVRADGTFEHQVDFGADTAQVHAGAPGHGTASTTVTFTAAGDGEPAHVELVLPAGQSITGRVVAQSGAAVPGAHVTLVPTSGPTDVPDYPGAWGPPIVAVSGEDGRFAVPSVDDGEWLLRASADGFRVGEARATVPGSAEPEIVLDAAFEIEGVVQYADGRPVPGAIVRATAEEGQDIPEATFADAQGRFCLRGLLPGRFSVHADRPPTSTENFAPASAANVAAGARDVRIVVQQGRTLTAVVVERDGAPCAGVQVQLIDDVGNSQLLTTGHDGRFQAVGLAASRVTVEVQAPVGSGGTLAIVQDDVATDAGANRDVATGDGATTLVLPRRVRVDGVLVDESGSPLTDLDLRISPDAAPVPGRFRDTAVRSLETGEDGGFSFDAIEAQRYRAQILVADGVVLVDADSIVGGARGVRLVARAGERVTGTVVEEAGRPAAGVQVTAQCGEMLRHGLSTGDGTFTVAGLLPGASYTLRGGGTDWIARGAVEVKAGAIDVRLEVRRGLVLAGRLLRADGSGAANVWIRFESDGNTTWTGTGENGEFAVRGLLPGAVELHARTEGGETSLGSFAAGQTDLLLRLR